MNQYWINVLNSAHSVSAILAIVIGAITLTLFYWYALTYNDSDFKTSFRYPLISALLLILTLLLYIFTSPIN